VGERPAGGTAEDDVLAAEGVFAGVGVFAGALLEFALSELLPMFEAVLQPAAKTKRSASARASGALPRVLLGGLISR
jgi:hypothetical protein